MARSAWLLLLRLPLAALPAWAAEPAPVPVPRPDAVVASPDAVSTPSARVHAEARRILEEMKDSRYSHATRVDKDEESYEVDCSGFATIVLKAVAPRSLASVPRAAGHKRPRALEFHEAFAAAPAEEKGAKGWRRIERLADARPGDLLAWRREEIKPGEDTGHIVIVDEAPVREDDGQFRVIVLDSTGKPHGDDTRQSGATGVGRGTIWLTVDEAGRPAGFRWRARDGVLTRRPIAIGRAVEATAP
jgi:hypothetical protein